MTTAARRRGTSKGDLREQALLEAAKTLLGHKRLSAVSTDELAAAAGLSRSSFYFYFDSKAAVLSALLEDITVQLREENGPWLEAAGPSPELLRSATAHTVALWSSASGLLQQAFSADDGQLSTWRDEVVERGIARTAAKLDRDRAAGLAPAGPPSSLGLARMLHGAKTELLLRPGGLSQEVLVEEIVSATLRLAYGS